MSFAPPQSIQPETFSLSNLQVNLYIHIDIQHQVLVLYIYLVATLMQEY